MIDPFTTPDDIKLPDDLDLKQLTTSQLDKIIDATCELADAAEALWDALTEIGVEEDDAFAAREAVAQVAGGDGWNTIPALSRVRAELMARPDRHEVSRYARYQDGRQTPEDAAKALAAAGKLRVYYAEPDHEDGVE